MPFCIYVQCVINKWHNNVKYRYYCFICKVVLGETRFKWWKLTMRAFSTRGLISRKTVLMRSVSPMWAFVGLETESRRRKLGVFRGTPSAGTSSSICTETWFGWLMMRAYTNSNLHYTATVHTTIIYNVSIYYDIIFTLRLHQITKNLIDQNEGKEGQQFWRLFDSYWLKLTDINAFRNRVIIYSLNRTNVFSNISIVFSIKRHYLEICLSVYISKD